ncbi:MULTISPECIES: acyltransferase family protein [Pseudomonas syringae group]|uniref:Acyltransferase 3 n=3 Tax=Pseudomonas syringae group TaxID=136849 RepID=A0A2V4QHS7_PSESJ|nr:MULTISPECIES: acyltransferase family protein [Pseudomonas syringae group]PYD09149.1 acyltransferase [Pseudomonas syringae pv. pisi]PYD26108.1 acyltransferase [Pseudomonas syringae pv. pisi]PYD27396.1 acyltransferase [Pseudomonas syringae pv. pisi]RMM21563.1 Acyltransferase 3 [Pseudomonas syringae pv. pisi]RMO33034.1 Acyltransferase 3 [Pseudomonas syringae pv. pisi]
MGIPHNPALGYRPEIDGLRALAVIPVVLFHAGLPLFSGGFVGVDIFFVISGYLITSIIIAEKIRGRFSLINFYERRARRILPALFVMMLICLPVAWLTLDPSDLKHFAKSLVAVPTFSSNVLFWLESGYFDATAELKPLLHTWTLAVEEQYYLFFPLLLMLAWGLGRKWLIVLLIVAALASLALAQLGAHQATSNAFYLLPARAWELLAGSFIAFYFAWRPRSIGRASVVDQAATLLGILLIGYAVVGFDSSTPFPGLNALVPVLGAVLIIVFAHGKTWVGSALSSRAPVAIGMLSYSAYLWHQPVFAFARQYNLNEPGLPLMLALTLVSLALAWLSWRFVEQPFRKAGTFNRRQIFTTAGAASTLFIALGLVGYVNNGFPQRFAVDPELHQAFADPLIRDKCDQPLDGKSGNVDFCLFGLADKEAVPDMALFGDSHSEALLSTFDAAARDQGRTLAHIGLGGCLPLLGVDVANGNYAAGVCEALAEREFEYVKQQRIKKVVLVARWTLYTGDDYSERTMSTYFLTSRADPEKSRETSRRVFSQALEHTIEAYRSIGAEVFIIAQVPQQMINPESLYYRLARDASEDDAQALQRVSELSVPVEKHDLLQRFTRQLFLRASQSKHISLITLDDAFCKDRQCLIGDLHSYYKDFNHLNARGAGLLAGQISHILDQ